MLSISIKLSKLSRAQAWYIDFAIGALLFIFTIVVYLGYTNNFQSQGNGAVDVLLKDAKAISSSLVLSGYPDNWDNTNVIRIGIADNHKINGIKINNFKNLNYSLTKKDFATYYDYFVYFADSNNQVLNVQGVCGVGHPLINLSYNTKSAYYYQDDVTDFKLRDFMSQTFKADIYFKDQSNDIYSLYGLMSNISKYSFVVMEHPSLSASDYDIYKDQLNNYVSSGGLFMLSGELTSAQGQDLIGGTFYKKSGQSASDRNSTVNNTGSYLPLSLGDSIVFAQAYYVQNSSSTANFIPVAIFNQDGNYALGRWQYGSGTAYFFSDFDVAYLNGNFINIVESAAESIIGGTCTPLNITASINPKDIVKTERYLSYNSKVVKMITYVWQ